jgi:hypothetical protein
MKHAHAEFIRAKEKMPKKLRAVKMLITKYLTSAEAHWDRLMVEVEGEGRALATALPFLHAGPFCATQVCIHGGYHGGRKQERSTYYLSRSPFMQHGHVAVRRGLPEACWMSIALYQTSSWDAVRSGADGQVLGSISIRSIFR